VLCLATAVASEVGYDVAVVELYTGSLGEPGSDGDTLIKMLESNVARIVEALRKP
jgi:ABC-type Zn uptake system ZnuABC Zn-binding protein ZnuA